MKQVIILVGISGQGKSTFAKTWLNKNNPYIIETDSIRKELCGDASDQSKNKLVFEVARDRFETWLMLPNIEHDICIVDATNLTINERYNWYNIIKAYEMEPRKDIEINLIFFVPNIEKAIIQNSKRDRFVPVDVIKKQANKIQFPDDWEMKNCNIEWR